MASLKLLAVILFACVLAVSAFSIGNRVDAACPWEFDYTLEFGAFARDVGWLTSIRKGYFAEQRLCVHYRQVSGSVQQFNSLASGDYDVISTAADNVANRIVNQNLDLTVVGAFDLGVGLDFVTKTAAVPTWESLQNAAISVDAPDSGFVLDLLWMARDSGLDIEVMKHNFQITGGAFARYIALVNGVSQPTVSGVNTTVVSSMLNNPFTVKLPSTFQILAKFRDYVAPYQNLVAAVNSTWLQDSDHQEALIRLLSAWSSAQQFVMNPANQAEVIGILQTDVGNAILNLNPAQAFASYLEITDPKGPLNSNCLVSLKGLENVIMVRQNLGYFNAPVNAKRFVRQTLWDGRYCHQALDRIGADEPDHEY